MTDMIPTPEHIEYIDKMETIINLRDRNHRLKNLLIEIIRSIDHTNYWRNIIITELDKEGE